MPSIRRSLIAYFLILLSLALAAVGLIVHQLAGGALWDREAIAAKQIEQDYRTQRVRAEEQFNDGLEKQAVALGRDFRHKSLILVVRDRASEFSEWDLRTRLGILALAPSGITSNWNALISAPHAVYDRRYGRNQLYWTLQRQHFDEQLRHWFADDTAHYPPYFEIHDTRASRLIRSPSGELPPLPTSDEFNKRMALGAAWVDDATVGDIAVRRVIVQAPTIGMPPRGRLPDPGRLPVTVHGLYGGLLSAVPVTAFLDRGYDPIPYVYVQVARPKEDLEAEFRAYKQQRDDAIQAEVEKTREAMTGLRTNLLLIAGLSFLALAAGGWWLVGRGVAPIRKLSHAVSQVSEKDFFLPVKQDDLSLELLPIHDRLTQTLDELRRAFEREKQAVADISHELKTPLAALLTSMDVTLRKPRTAEQYKATLEECRDIGRQLSRLVERIMTLASLDAGNDRTVSERVDAADVATECGLVARPLAEAHGLTFTTAIDGDAEMLTDPDKLREVLNNLLGNAIEYNRPGGSIELRVSADRGRVTFEVKDTGIGMTPEVRTKIFERFYRADPSRHETGVHAGLGLAIVKEYVERLGGTITVESEPDVGSTFRVTLPTAPAAAAGGNGSVGRSGYIPSLAVRVRAVAGSGGVPATPPR
jgi:signal transduction histidine kinase